MPTAAKRSELIAELREAVATLDAKAKTAAVLRARVAVARARVIECPASVHAVVKLEEAQDKYRVVEQQCEILRRTIRAIWRAAALAWLREFTTILVRRRDGAAEVAS